MCAETVLRHKKDSRFACAHQTHFSLSLSRNTRVRVLHFTFWHANSRPSVFIFGTFGILTLIIRFDMHASWDISCLIFIHFFLLNILCFYNFIYWRIFFHCSWCLIRRIRTHSVSATIHKDTSGKAKRYIIIFRHGNGKMTARSTLRCYQLKIKIIFSLPFFSSHLTSRSLFFPRPMFISSNLFPFHLESFTCYMLRKWNSICHEQHLSIGMGIHPIDFSHVRNQ